MKGIYVGKGRNGLAVGAVAALAASLLIATASSGEAGVSGTWCADKSDIAVLGASTEVGKGLPDYEDPGEGAYAPTRYGWVSRTERNVRAEWGTTVHNYSRSGAMARDYAPGGRWGATRGAVADIQRHGVDLIVLDLGANEYMNDVAPAVFERELRSLVQRARGGRGTDVLILGHWRIDRPSAWPWREYIAAMNRVARSERAALVDFQQHIDSTDADGAGLWSRDRVHLNEAGQSVVAGSVWSWLVAGC